MKYRFMIMNKQIHDSDTQYIEISKKGRTKENLKKKRKKRHSYGWICM